MVSSGSSDVIDSVAPCDELKDWRAEACMDFYFSKDVFPDPYTSFEK